MNQIHKLILHLLFLVSQYNFFLTSERGQEYFTMFYFMYSPLLPFLLQIYPEKCQKYPYFMSLSVRPVASSV